MPSVAEALARQADKVGDARALLEFNVGCQRKSSGTGQGSKGSSGRSAQFHQICRPLHLHSVRQVRRPSSSRPQRTKPPDFMGWLHSGQAGASSVMPRTLTERPLRPEANWVRAVFWGGVALSCWDSPRIFVDVRRCSWPLSLS